MVAYVHKMYNLTNYKGHKYKPIHCNGGYYHAPRNQTENERAL